MELFCHSLSFQGQQYAILSNLKKTGKILDNPNQTVYSEIQHVLSSHQVQTTNISPQTITTTQLEGILRLISSEISLHDNSLTLAK